MNNLKLDLMESKFVFLPVVLITVFLCLGCEEDRYSPCSNCADEIVFSEKEGALKYVTVNKATGDVPVLSPVDRKEYEYDIGWRISKISTSRSSYGSEFRVFKYEVYQYNTAGQLTEINEYTINSVSGKHGNFYNRKFTYSSDGKIERLDREFPAIGTSDYTLHFYENGNLVQMERYDGQDGTLQKYFVNEYDDAGNLVREDEFSAIGRPGFSRRHVVENGLITKTSRYAIFEEDDGYRESLQNEFFYTYDASKNLLVVETKSHYPTTVPYSRYSYYTYEYY